MDEQNDLREAIRQQVAAILRKAELIFGGRERLAECLEVHPRQVAEWLAARADMPMDLLGRAIALTLERIPEFAHDGGQQAC